MPAATTKRAYTKLTDQQWVEIAEKYAEGVSQTDLAQEYGVSLRSIQGRMPAARYQAGKQSKRQRITDARATIAGIASTTAALSADATTTEERQKHTREAAWAQSVAIEATLTNAIADLAGKDAGVVIGKLDIAASVARRLYDLRHLALGMSKIDGPDELPELPIREMTTAEVEAVVTAQVQADGMPTPDDLEYVATMDGAASDASTAGEVIEEGEPVDAIPATGVAARRSIYRT